jgi:hypothetical protein
MYGLVNTIMNRSLILVYWAYSAPAENGDDYDIRKVSNAGSFTGRKTRIADVSNDRAPR